MLLIENAWAAWIALRRRKVRLTVISRRILPPRKPDETLLGAYRYSEDFAPTAGLLAGSLERTRIYRELGLGPSMASKSVQPTNKPGDFLEEDGSNLVLILNRMELDDSREQVEGHLKRFLRGRFNAQVSSCTRKAPN